jgi:hypothetical protein
MTTTSRWGSLLAVLLAAGCAPVSPPQPSGSDALGVAEGAAAAALDCATDLDEMAVTNPEAAQLGRQEISRRLQVVLDAGRAVDRFAAHAGPWSAPQDVTSFAEQARSASGELCRATELSLALVRRSSPKAPPPESVSLLLGLDGTHH